MYLFCVLLRVLFKVRCNFICPRVQLIHHHCVMWIAKLKRSMRTQSVVLIYTAISRKVVGKNVHATIPKGDMGYNQNTVPDIVAVEPSFVVFL